MRKHAFSKPLANLGKSNSNEPRNVLLFLFVNFVFMLFKWGRQTGSAGWHFVKIIMLSSDFSPKSSISQFSGKNTFKLQKSLDVI